MATDNVPVLPSLDPSARPVATDNINGVDYQRLKVDFGSDGTAIDVADDELSRLPVGGGMLLRIAEALETLAGLATEEMADEVVDRLLGLLMAPGVTLGAGTSAIGSVRRAEAAIYSSLAVGASATDPIDIRGYTPSGILVPSTFSGASLSFQVSPDNINWSPLYDMTNVVVSMSVTAARAYPLWGELNGWSWMKVVSNTAQLTKSADFVLQVKS